jgi:CHASE2 domain-containing sensor protein
MPLAQLLEQYVSLGILVLAAGLSILSFLAWRRERDSRMRTVTLGYAMFAAYGLIVFLEYPLLPYFPYATLELLEHGSAMLILGGLLTFFITLTRD